MSTTGRCRAVKSEMRISAVFSRLTREKSGARSPTCRPPERACVHRVSKGNTINAAGSGSLVMKRPKSSGGWRMARYRAAQTRSHTIASRLSPPSTARDLRLAFKTTLPGNDFAICRFARDDKSEKRWSEEKLQVRRKDDNV